MKIFNTLSRQKEEFKPLRGKKVGLYTCGPTVYGYAHIGNLRTYLFEDTLRRALEYFGYKVKHVMNITDVGHLTSDADEGEDKLEKGAQKEGKTVWEIADFYTKAFLEDIDKLNIKRPRKLVRATATIKEQIGLIKKIWGKGYGYETSQAIYFDVFKFKDYAKLSRQNLEEQKVGARDQVVEDPEKKNPYDFALWFKRVGRFKNHTMRWPSPWGDGFPGWHIECSAISAKYLGQPFDIHTGGVDHIGTHHTNEIAQSEAAYDKPLARFWLHGEFLLVDGQKMSKSLGNLFILRDLEEKGFGPFVFRYLNLGAHYRSKLNFSWNSMQSSQTALEKLRAFILELKSRRHTGKNDLSDYKKLFGEALADDLNTPEALAVIWKLVGDYHKEPQKFDSKKVLKLIYDFDKVLGLNLKKARPEKIPAEIKALAAEREKLRQEKRWQEADVVRQKIEALGWSVKDTPEGSIVTRA